MDWNALRSKRTSLSGPLTLPKLQPPASHKRYPISNNYTTNPENMLIPGAQSELRTSYYLSQHPLFCADWISGPFGEFAALSSFREGFQNRIQLVGGNSQHFTNSADSELLGDLSPKKNGHLSRYFSPESSSEMRFDFALLAEAPTDYPVTSLQWEPHGNERLAASSEALRLFRVSFDSETPQLVQTHLLANNLTANGGSSSNNNAGASVNSSTKNDINTFPPVTAFDWNKCDPSVVITLSVDTTCTVWDLLRSRAVGKNVDSAHVKTQLIAHDSEVFDVKFVHMSTDVFASVLNDGSMRVFDLRSLEHSTIIYEPTGAGAVSVDQMPNFASCTAAAAAGANYNPQALLRLLASNTDQHTLATVGVNLNQVLIIDLRMPGVPVATIDALFDGQSHAAINLIQWHPSSNLLATGGDDCQALVWDCSGKASRRATADGKVVIDTPMLAYAEDLEVNNVCWRRERSSTGGLGNINSSSWMGVVSGKGFQALDAS